MTYSKSSNIEGYYLGVNFSAAKALVTSKQVKAWINTASIEIDMVLRRKYSLPISNSDDLVILQDLCEKIVVGKVDAIYRNSSSDESEKKYIRERNYSKDALKILEGLTSGSLMLVSSPKNLAPIGYRKGVS